MTETRFEVPLWLQLAVWPALTLVLCLALLQPVKGAVVGLQYALGMHGFGAARTSGRADKEDARDGCTKRWRTTDRLTSAETRPQRSQPSAPSDAATLIIIDRKAARPKVLMGKRHAGLKFMPGKFVFPGGRIEAGDRSMPVAGALHRPRRAGPDGAGAAAPRRQRGRALALAAIRETFEETGLLLGTREYGAPETGPDRRAWSGVPGARRVARPRGPALHRAARSRRRKRAEALRHPLLRRRPDAPSPTRSRASSGRTPSWSNWPGSRSPQAQGASTCRRSPTSILDGAGGRGSRRASRRELPVPFYHSAAAASCGSAVMKASSRTKPAEIRDRVKDKAIPSAIRVLLARMTTADSVPSPPLDCPAIIGHGTPRFSAGLARPLRFGTMGPAERRTEQEVRPWPKPPPSK